MTRRTAWISLILGLCFFSHYSNSSDVADIVESLSNDVKTAQRKLASSEARIARETASAYRSLHKKQIAVAKLREQAAVAKRKSDEQTLSLDVLQKRLKKWQDQHQYQTYLFIDYAEKISASAQQKTEISQNMGHGLRLLKKAVETKEQQLSPAWQSGKIVLPEGRVEPADIINIGPVAWFWQSERQRGGLATLDGSAVGDSRVVNNQPLYRALQVFDAKNREALAALYASQQGHIYFDPTLDRAQKIASQRESVLQHIEKGGLWVVPILLFALVALLIAAIKALQLWRLPKLQTLLAERIQSLIKGSSSQSDIQQLQQGLLGAEADLVAIVAATPVSQQRDERLLACLLENRHRLEQLLGAIAVTAAVSPLLGLLGTVSGMIETFKMMTIFGAGDPATVSGGISEALITTEMGLVVAIPALLLHALLSRQIRNYNSQLETTAVKLGPLTLPENSL